MSFEIVSADELTTQQISLRAPSNDMQKYIDYVRQLVNTGRADAVGKVKPDIDGTVDDLMREANNLVQRIKRAAFLAGHDMIVTKAGSDVYFRLPQDGETPNAGPNAPKRTRSSGNGPMSVRDFQNLSVEQNGAATEAETEPAADTADDEEEATAGGRRRR